MTNFNTFKQFQDAKKAEFMAEFPDDREYLNDWMGMNATISHYESYCAELINSGVMPPLSVADTWTPETLYNLKKHYTNRGSLDWYIPRAMRTNKEQFMCNPRVYPPLPKHQKTDWCDVIGCIHAS